MIVSITLLALGALAPGCANDTLRAQTPTTTTGPYNTGTTATPGLSATKAEHALGEDPRRPVGAIAPAPAVETKITSTTVTVPANAGVAPNGQ